MSTAENQKKLTLLEHLIELRNRLIIAVGFFILFLGICYFYVEDIYFWLVKPLIKITGNSKMIYTGLSEAFFTYLKLASFSSLLISFPFLFWQIYKFIAPGLYTKEKNIILPFLLATPLLFWAGILFAYYVVFPMAWQFFINFEQYGRLNIILEARVAEYLGIVMQLMFAFGLAFELPVILMIMLKTKLVSIESLINRRRYAIILIFVIAAIITPPDVFSQVALAVPMILLYELVIIYGKRLRTKTDARY